MAISSRSTYGSLLPQSLWLYPPEQLMVEKPKMPINNLLDIIRISKWLQGSLISLQKHVPLPPNKTISSQKILRVEKTLPGI